MNGDYREMGARLKPLHRTKAAEGDGREIGARLKPLRRAKAAEGDGGKMWARLKPLYRTKAAEGDGREGDGSEMGWWAEVKRREGVSKWILTHPLSVGVI
ncbi:MAG: hypothetical protein PUD39_02795 [Bacteroidales bacterium]|nr:hypothetical protein [Bacteroidales bacterium]